MRNVVDINERMSGELGKRQEAGAFRVLSHSNELVDFSSNDYLSLSRTPELIDDINLALSGIKELGATGSRLLSGNKEYHEELERKLSKIHQSESALLMNSGYVANLSVLSSVPKKGDTIIYDELIHACVKDGARLSMANRLSFKHNNINDLKLKLAKASGQVFVVVESVYSMDGDEAPINEIVNLKSEFDFHMIVDEAHSTGNYGVNGAGLCAELGVTNHVFARIHTFGKAIGAHGAVVACSSLLRDYLINHARQFIYTTAMSSHSVLTISKAYDYIQQHPGLLSLLKNKISLFKSLITTETGSFSPIQPVIVPGNDACVNLSRILNKEGFDVRPVRYPTVHMGSERLRICIHVHNTDDEIRALANLINHQLQSN